MAAIRLFALSLGVGVLLAASTARATPVGELHRVALERTASLRDAMHRPEVRITVWYPAAAGAAERPVVVGPPGRPMFEVGQTAPDAAFADGQRRPVILLSHGFGSSARIMGWFGIALARDGYIVVAVDHPGNNGADTMTVAGALLWWERTEDLRAALAATVQDPLIGPHMDLNRVGVAGFSAGGFTALVAAGARVDRDHFARFCAAHPDDGVCGPQRELVVTADDYREAFSTPAMQAEAALAGNDHSLPEVKAAFVMAPALVQALDPVSLARLGTPLAIVLGDADTVAPPATNGLAAAKASASADLTLLPGVGHYDFLATCTEAGKAALPGCRTEVPQGETHRRTIAAATAFFHRYLGAAR